MQNKPDYFLCWIWGNLCQIKKIDSYRVYVLIGTTIVWSQGTVFDNIFESQVEEIVKNILDQIIGQGSEKDRNHLILG